MYTHSDLLVLSLKYTAGEHIHIFVIKNISARLVYYPAFFPLLHNQIRSTLSVGGIPIFPNTHPSIHPHSAYILVPGHVRLLTNQNN